MWQVWNKTSNINKYSASEFLEKNKHLKDEEVIFIKVVNDYVIEIQGKSTLSKIYGISEKLSNETFIQKYQELTIVKPSTNGELQS